MSGYDVILTPSAEEDLLEIAEYIALDNAEAAFIFIDELTDRIRRNLSLFPTSGRIYHEAEANEEIRVFPYGNYLSFYRINERKKAVEVLHIFNGKRQISRLLNDEL